MNPNPYETPQQTRYADPYTPARFAMSAFVIVLLSSIAFASIAPGIARFQGAPIDIFNLVFRISMLVCIPFGLAVAIASYVTIRSRWRITRLTWFFASMLIVIPIEMHPQYSGPLVEWTGIAIFATILTAIATVWLIRRFWPESQVTP